MNFISHALVKNEKHFISFELGEYTFHFISTHLVLKWVIMSSNDGVRVWCPVIFFKAHTSGGGEEVRPMHTFIETNKHA
jgi:hypothetical protein